MSIQPLTCQDFPVVPMLKQQDLTNFDLLTFQQPTPCTTPATSVIPLKLCEGHTRGYSGRENAEDHGANFYVCQHCFEKAWEAYSMFVKCRGVDLCSRCSLDFRRRNRHPIRPPNHLPQCMCLWDDKIWHCTTCRIVKARMDRDNALSWIQDFPVFIAMHVRGPRHPSQAFGRPTIRQR
jgi:hypothetical protein